MTIRINRDNFIGTLTWHDAIKSTINAVTTPLQNESILLDLNYGCHVDHEGFDLNQIEQEYHKAHKVQLNHDPTLYKDGAGPAGTYAIIEPWCYQSEHSDFGLVVDHSHFVYRYPIQGLAAEQIRDSIKKRPELLRLLTPTFKCGLDLCIDYFKQDTVQPIVHIEWDYSNLDDMKWAATKIRNLCIEMDWEVMVPAIIAYNKLAKSLGIDAFTQANTRSQLLFGQNSYMLIPTI